MAHGMHGGHEKCGLGWICHFGSFDLDGGADGLFVDLVEEEGLLGADFLAELSQDVHADCDQEHEGGDPEAPGGHVEPELAGAEEAGEDSDQSDEHVAVEEGGPDVGVGAVSAVDAGFAFEPGFEAKAETGGPVVGVFFQDVEADVAGEAFHGTTVGMLLGAGNDGVLSGFDVRVDHV
jgi:hypothetical protein